VSGTPSVTTAAACAFLGVVSLSAQAPLPTVERLLTDPLGFTASQLTALRRGEAVTVAIAGSLERELVIAGAVHIEAPAERTVDLVRDIERFESGARFLSRKRVSDPPNVEDFAAFRLTPADLAALRQCRPGRCNVKLDQDAFPALAAIDWRAADAAARANALVRQRVLGYLDRYRAEGNRASVVYSDRIHPVVAEQEFAEMVTASAALGAVAGDLAHFLLQYPQHRPPGTEDFFFWSVSDLGLKPVFRLSHVVIRHLDGVAGLRHVIATKLLYANHYFNTGLEVRALFDDPARPGRAHVLVTLDHARLDGLTGPLGRLAKARVRAASRDALLTSLRSAKQRGEARQTVPSGPDD
jgi:hypothetical protein